MRYNQRKAFNVLFRSRICESMSLSKSAQNCQKKLDFEIPIVN